MVKSRNYKVFNNFCLMIMLCFSFALFLGQKVKAMEYTYESGSVTETFDDVTVNSFEYDYITKFTAKTNYYKGYQIYDDGVVISENKSFYSGRSIKINVKHVDKFWAWEKDDDKTIIYKYNFTRNDFNANLRQFINESGSYVLDEEGVYKIVYVFEGEVKKTNYVFITADIHEGKVVGNEKYLGVSAFGEFSFKLSLKDAYDLRNYTYYYGFGNNIDQVQYTKFEVFSESEKKAEETIKEISNRELQVDILDIHTADNVAKKMFVKVTRTINNVEKSWIVGSESKYNLVSNLEAHMYLADEDGNLIKEKKVFKSGDTIIITALFNAPVTFSNMEYSVDGGVNFFEVGQDVTEAVTSFTIRYLASSYHFEEKVFAGGLLFRTKNSNKAIVTNNGVNVTLKCVDASSFAIDMSVPEIGEYVSTPTVGEVDAFGKYEVDVTINEDNVDKIYYYAAICNVVQDNKCYDSFNSDNANIVVVNNDTIVSVSGNTKTVRLVVDNKFGSYNGEVVTLFVKVVDLAGNEVTDKSTNYKMDNIIIVEEEKEHFLYIVDVVEEDEVVGKAFYVDILKSADVSAVSYEIANAGVNQCSVLNSDEVYNVYKCFEIKGYDLTADVTVKITDIHNNTETYVKQFKYSTMRDGTAAIGGYNFNTHSNEMFDMSISLYNKMGNDEDRVVLNADVLNGIKETLKFDLIPDVSDLGMSLVYLNGEETRVLIENINNNLVIPSTIELLEKLNDIEKYKSCFLNTNKCDMDLYIKYFYKVVGIEQSRYVKITLVDNYNKYLIEDFDENIVLNVKDTFNEIVYEMVDNVNIKITAANVIKNKVIVFEDLKGVSSVVETVDTSKLGVYKIDEYYVYNNISSCHLKYFVTVVDNVAPVIRFNIDNKMTLHIGDKLPDHESIVAYSDNYDTELTLQYMIEPEFDSEKAGKYVISYWVVDSSGNSSEVIKLTVTVKEASQLNTYLIVGGIVLVVVLLMAGVTILEIKKERRK